ncbi:hypothetical protein ACIBHY_25575 [Nonomuraea sp. NPDC050547]|uniref:hypothetical protein n=1 Tax=Nonomuraea sp. NPDC050547 TaxID=3364368 RepID=UPI0037A8CE9D
MKAIIRWVMPALVLLGFAIFFNDRGGKSEPDFTMAEVNVIEGTVAAFDVSRTQTGTGNRQSTRVDYLLTLTGRPQNVSFRLDTTPAGGVTAGMRVRLEILEDAEEAFTSATRYPDGTNRIHAVGAVVDGKPVYTAAEYVARSESAASGNGRIALIFLLLALAWGAVVYFVKIRPYVRSGKAAW